MILEDIYRSTQPANASVTCAARTTLIARHITLKMQ
jgi:hypothetical protein